VKEVWTLFTFSIGAMCFVVFVTIFKPDAISTMRGRGKPGLRVSQQASELGDNYGVHSITAHCANLSAALN
jgi:hypothetical protein